MQRPPPPVYVIGNTFSACVIIGLSCLMTYQWWIGLAGSDWVPVIALLLSIAAVNANTRLSAYANWKEAWDAMEGKTRRRFWPRLRPIVTLVVWVVGALVLAGLDYHRQPANVLALVGFSGLTLMKLIGFFRGRRASAPRKPGKLVIVSVVQPVPRHSPSAVQAVSDLPAYCRGVIDPPTRQRA